MTIQINGTTGISGVDGSAATPALQGTDSNTGIHFPAADTVAIDTGGSERLRVDSSGRVGIGTTSVSTILHVASSAPYIRIQDNDSNIASTAQGGFEMYDSDGDRLFFLANDSSSSADVSLFNNAGGALKFGTSGSERGQFDSSGRLLVGTSSSDWTRPRVVIVGNPNETTTGAGVLYLQKANGTVSTGDKIGEIAFSTSSSNVGVYAEIICEGDATGGSADFPGRLVFKTCADGGSSTTERMRIANDGTVTIDGRNGSATNDLYLFLPSPGTSRNFLTAETVGVGTWRLQGNGTSTFTSDERRKKNIETARNGYLEDINKLRVVKYNWRAHEDDAPKEIGLIAQEVEQVFPGLISEYTDSEEGNTYKALKHSVLPFMLLKALQEATQRIETLEAKVAALESA